MGQREEDNLRHLVTNLGDDAPRTRVVPFPHGETHAETIVWTTPTAPSATDSARSWCLGGDERAWDHPAVSPARQRLRGLIRRRQPTLELGGWANPHKDAATQVGYLLDAEATTDFFLTPGGLPPRPSRPSSGS